MFLICDDCLERDSVGPDRLRVCGGLDYGTCVHCNQSGDCLTVTTKAKPSELEKGAFRDTRSRTRR